MDLPGAQGAQPAAAPGAVPQAMTPEQWVLTVRELERRANEQDTNTRLLREQLVHSQREVEQLRQEAAGAAGVAAAAGAAPTRRR